MGFFLGLDRETWKHSLIRFTRDVAALMSIRFGAMGLSFLIAIFLARSLGPVEYGLYTFAMTVFLVIEPLAGGGIGTLSVRELAGKSQSDEEKRALIGRLFSVTLLISVVVSGLVVLAITLSGRGDGQLLYMALLVAPTATLMQTASGTLAGQGLVKRGQFVSQLGKPAVFLALAGAVWIGATSYWTPAAALVLQGISACLAIGLAVWLSPLKPRFRIGRSFRFAGWAGLLRAAFPFAMITALQYFQTRIDILSIGWLMGDADVGHYHVATRLAQFTSLPASMVALLMAPRFARLFKEGAKDRLRLLFWRANVPAIGGSVMLFAVLFVFGDALVLGFFGEPYVKALEPFHILLVAQLLLSANVIAVVLLSMAHRERGLAVMLLVTASMNAGANWLLIPQYGLLGAAVATSAAGMVTLAWIIVQLYRSRLIARAKA